VVAVVDFVGAAGGNGGILFHADAVAAGLVDGGVEVAPDGFAGALGGWLG